MEKNEVSKTRYSANVYLTESQHHYNLPIGAMYGIISIIMFKGKYTYYERKI